jgi:hypothetical protein
MVRTSLRCAGMFLPALAIACAFGQSGSFPSSATVRPAADAPAYFTPGGNDAVPEAPCRTPLRDPRDGTQIMLLRSANGFGDYAVPPGQYGVGERQLLRLECGTAKVVGVVPR